jgi:hypothetical protein
MRCASYRPLCGQHEESVVNLRLDNNELLAPNRGPKKGGECSCGATLRR